MGSMPAEEQQSRSPSFDQLLKECTLQVSWACSASLVNAVADKLTACLRQAATDSSDSHHTQEPWRLPSRSHYQHRMGSERFGSAWEVLGCAWEVLSADDALITAAPRHSGTLLNSIKHLLHPDNQARRHELTAHSITLLLHFHAASAGLQVCCHPPS